MASISIIDSSVAGTVVKTVSVIEDIPTDEGHTHRQRMSRDTNFGIVGERRFKS